MQSSLGSFDKVRAGPQDFFKKPCGNLQSDPAFTLQLETEINAEKRHQFQTVFAGSGRTIQKKFSRTAQEKWSCGKIKFFR